MLPSGLKRLVVYEGPDMEDHFPEEAEAHGKGKSGNRQVRHEHGDPHGRRFNPIMIKFQAMTDPVIDYNDKKQGTCKVHDRLHEMCDPAGNGLDDGVHGEMGPCLDGDTCPQEGHEDTDVTGEFLKPGKVVVKSIT